MFKFLKDKLAKIIGKPVDSIKEEKKAKSKTLPKPAKKPEKSAKKEKPVKKPVKPKEEETTQSEFLEVEQVQEEEKPKIIEEIEEKEEKTKVGFFARLKEKISSAKITEQDFEEIFYELELALLESNVALDTVDKIKANLKQSLVNAEVKRADVEQRISEALKEAISQVLIEPPNLINQIKSKPGIYTIIFFGINGTGKTTTIAKLASLLKQNNISCVLAAGDTFRAAAIQQLELHANNLKVPIIKHDYDADPTAVAFDAKKYAQEKGIKVVLIDTAGRMYTKENLMKQMEKIMRVIQPDLKLFIGESITGNDAIDQAKTFNEAVGIDGIILSKADVDEKGGTALSVSHITGKPIYFLGTGQAYSDLQPFKKDIILKNLGL